MNKFKCFTRLLLLITVFTFTNCQKDDSIFVEPESTISNTYDISRIETINYKKIINDDVKQKVKALLPNGKNNNEVSLSRENRNEIVIDTSSIKYLITDDGYQSYTFDVISSLQSNFIENIVISHHSNDSIQTILATHYLSESISDFNSDNINQSISHSTFDYIDASTSIQESSNELSRGSGCITVSLSIMVDKCKGENLGADDCNDGNGQPLQVPHTVIIAEACGPSGGGGTSGANNGTNQGDPGGNDPSTGGSYTPGLSDGYIITAPNINIATELISALELHKFDDIDFINLIRNNYNSLGGDNSIVINSFSYLLVNNFSEDSKDLILELLELIISDPNLSYIEAIEAHVANLFATLVDDEDSVVYDPNIDASNSISLNSIQDFITYIEDVELETNINNELIVGGGFSKKFRVKLGGITTINISVIQELKDDSIDQDYEIMDIVTIYSGLTIASSWEQESSPNDYVIVGNVAIINLEGNIHYNLFVEGVGTIFSDKKQYELKINIETGEAISITEIQD